ncbi:MAG: glucose-1-phosphate cytidylyltransferase [Rhodospirillales bacterium]|nr:glucose-1-phosphate cytidylyltransferase [Rhodospirillales bacterium]
MKVVLFCGGLGMRLRDYSHTIPKPMVPLRYRPIIWHVMKYYAHYGHRDFILCLGYKGDVIKDYFLNYSECLSNDFVLSEGGQRVELLRRDISDWRITFVDTGLTSNIGERLKVVQPFLEDEEMFLANYSDGLTDCPLPMLIDWHRRQGGIATFIAVRPNHSFHVTTIEDDGRVTGIHDVKSSGMWINGGYFVLGREIFDYLRAGEELVLAPFQRLIERQALSAYRHEGFWRGVDTFKDLQELENMLSQGDGAWEVWRTPSGQPAPASPVSRFRSRRGNGGHPPTLHG